MAANYNFEYKYDDSTDWFGVLIYKDSKNNTLTLGDTGELKNSLTQDFTGYLAPYWTKKVYPAKSLVRYGLGTKAKLYYNPHEIATAEGWTEAHWTETTIANYIKLMTTT